MRTLRLLVPALLTALLLPLGAPTIASATTAGLPPFCSPASTAFSALNSYLPLGAHPSLAQLNADIAALSAAQGNLRTASAKSSGTTSSAFKQAVTSDLASVHTLSSARSFLANTKSARSHLAQLLATASKQYTALDAALVTAARAVSLQCSSTPSAASTALSIIEPLINNAAINSFDAGHKMTLSTLSQALKSSSLPATVISSTVKSGVLAAAKIAVTVHPSVVHICATFYTGPGYNGAYPIVQAC